MENTLRFPCLAMIRHRARQTWPSRRRLAVGAAVVAVVWSCVAAATASGQPIPVVAAGPLGPAVHRPIPRDPSRGLPMQPANVPLQPLQPAGMPFAAVGAEPDGNPWALQWLPDGLIYKTYMAAPREPKLASVWSSEAEFGPVWDIALGGRVGILRYGTLDQYGRPEGWQFDVEGAAFPRLDPDGESTPLVAVDFRAGLWLTRGRGPWHFKFGYYHLSAHLGDEFLLQHPGTRRINYARDVIVFGADYYWNDALRLYGEIGYAAGIDGGARPWETQFGIEFSPPHTSLLGSPFAAVNAHLHQEVDFGGNFVVQAGWQWRQGANGRALRLGAQYLNGMNDQYEFFDDYESKIGGGVWVDY